MKLHIIAAALPPQLDGIGDYTACLAAELVHSADVTVLTGAANPGAIPGATVQTAFLASEPASVHQLLEIVKQDKPDWVLLQYNPFSYGRRGLNLHLPGVMHRLRYVSPGTRLAVMAHETFMPVVNWQSAVMTLWQRWQFRRIGNAASVLFFSTEASAAKYRPKFTTVPVVHLPVGSNILYQHCSRSEVRKDLGIRENTLVLGLFGTMHISRMLERVKSAYEIAAQSKNDVVVLYVGPHVQAVRDALGSTPVIAEGALPNPEISRRFAAMDIYLTPFTDGISTRRGTLMSGLQHGVALVGTRGYNTDTILKQEGGKSFLLADVCNPTQFDSCVETLVAQPEIRSSLAKSGQNFYGQHFTWQRITSQMLFFLEAAL